MKVSSIVFSIFISSSICFAQSIDKIKERIAYTDSINNSKDKHLIQLMKNSQNQIINYDQTKYSSGDIRSTYYILIGKNNKALAFSIHPFSESGNWFKQHLYYLNDEEKVINYTNTFRFFNGICIDGVLVSFQSVYYDGDSNILEQISTLTDREGNDMTDQGCVMNYKNPLKPRNDLSEILSEEGIEKSW